MRTDAASEDQDEESDDLDSDMDDESDHWIHFEDDREAQIPVNNICDILDFLKTKDISRKTHAVLLATAMFETEAGKTSLTVDRVLDKAERITPAIHETQDRVKRLERTLE